MSINRIRIQASVAGTNFSYTPGQEVEVANTPDAQKQAEQFERAGYATVLQRSGDTAKDVGAKPAKREPAAKPAPAEKPSPAAKAPPETDQDSQLEDDAEQDEDNANELTYETDEQAQKQADAAPAKKKSPNGSSRKRN